MRVEFSFLGVFMVILKVSWTCVRVKQVLIFGVEIEGLKGCHGCHGVMDLGVWGKLLYGGNVWGGGNTWETIKCSVFLMFFAKMSTF